MENKNHENKSEEKSDRKFIWSERGSIVMERRIVLWIVIAVLFIAVLFLTFKIGAGNAEVVKTTATAASSVEKSAASSGMVGGC